MWSYWNDRSAVTEFGLAFQMLDELRRQVDPRSAGIVRENPDPDTLRRESPKANLFDTGSTFVVTLDVPGLREEDLKLTIHDDVLALSGTRKTDVPEGYTVHRRERVGYEFSRSLQLPAKVDPELTKATLKNGVLTLAIEKAPEHKPRQINVNIG